ncbi:MAG: hypothetical protein HKO09_07665 [Croceitalea sp.]|nr:hypothetical protein [Croceitalea sp.]
MKRIGLYLSAALIFTFAACSSNDNTPVDPVDDTPVVVDKSANLLATGASANDLLSNTNFDKLLIEIAFVEDFRPTSEAMDNFENYLRERTFKTNIDVEYKSLPPTGETELTLQQVAELESENRSAYNDGSTLAIYIFFADAPAEGDDLSEGLVTLGAVYRNTSMVIYEKTVKTLAGRSLTITTADVETAVLNHEFGHLFGLVNLGTPSVNAHEDAEAQNHCNVDGCLMRAELEFGDGIMSMLEKRASRGAAVVPDIDAECILDLQNSGGR